MISEREQSAADARDIVGDDLVFIIDLQTLLASPSTRAFKTFAKKHDPQALRRLRLRLFMSYVEGVAAALKAEAVSLTSPSRSPAAHALLQDKTFDLTDQGEPIERTFSPSLSRSLRFAFRMGALTKRLTVSPDYGGAGWKAFQEAVKLRNRITHPRRAEDFVISDLEVATLASAEEWFHTSYRDLMSADIVSLSRKLSVPQRRRRA